MTAFDLAVAVDELETEILRACDGESEWPARVAAGVYAGVDFARARPALAGALPLEREASGEASVFNRLVGRLAGFLRVSAPSVATVPRAAEEALVAGVVGLVGDHLRIDRSERLAELRPELVLLTLLPYLGFEEAQRWSNWSAQQYG